jgi:hypothetical protein
VIPPDPDPPRVSFEAWSVLAVIVGYILLVVTLLAGWW